jgi:hypothetical protein
MAPTTVFDLFIISYGQAGASVVSYRHFIFKKSLLTNNCFRNYQVLGHTSFSGFSSFCFGITFIYLHLYLRSVYLS